MDQLADRLDHAAATLTTVDRRVAVLTVDPSVFGPDAGLPGRLGRALHAHWTAVIDARAREAASAAAHLVEVAGSVRTTSRQYTETDEAARHRLGREM